MKAFANEVLQTEKYDQEATQVYYAGIYKANIFGSYLFCNVVFQSSAFTCLLWIVSLKFMVLNMSVGTTIAYLLFMKKIVDAFGELMNSQSQIARVRGSSYKIAELLQRETSVKMPTQGWKDPNPKGSIELENVSFNYPSKPEVSVLDGVDIQIAENKIVAFVGMSGCGKSSVMKLMERFYDPQKGELLYSGTNLKDLDNFWFHQE